MKTIFSIIAFIIPLYFSTIFATYWESQVHPIKNATLYPIEGDKIKGLLSWTTKGDYKIENIKGVILEIPRDSVIAVTYPSQNSLSGWRFLLPPLTVISIYLIYLLTLLPNLSEKPLTSVGGWIAR